MRQVARLDGAHRVALARSLALSFAATVGHVCRAIRKLAAMMAFSRPSSSMRESDGGGGQAELQVVETREEGKSFVAIRVEPAFV